MILTEAEAKTKVCRGGGVVETGYGNAGGWFKDFSLCAASNCMHWVWDHRRGKDDDGLYTVELPPNQTTGHCGLCREVRCVLL